MNWTYDASAGALYVELAARRSERQVELSPGVILDVDEEGSLIGVEVLHWQSVNVDAIAEQFNLDPETAKTLRAIIFQPVTTFLGYRQAEEPSLVAGVEASAPNTTATPELSGVG